MTFNLDPHVLTRAGRASVDEAAALRDAGALIDFGPTDVDDAAARDRLARRVHRLASRLGANGRELQAFVREADAIDDVVSLSFLVVAAREWR